jgi:HEAT repeat protein
MVSRMRASGRPVATTLLALLVLGCAAPVPVRAQEGSVAFEAAAAAEMLASSDPVVRVAGLCTARELEQRAAPLVPALVDALGDDIAMPRMHCRDGRPVADAWNSEPTTFGREAAITLSRIGSPAFDPAVDALEGGDAVTRANAALVLGALGTSASMAPLRAALGDATPEVRARAAWGLGAVGGAAAVPALGAAAGDGDAGVREQVAWALGAIGADAGVAAATGLLEDAEPAVRRQAAWALGVTGDEGAVAALVTALGDADPETREQTAWALGAIGDGRAAAGLAAALGDADPRVREQAAWALGAIGRAGRR